MAEAETCVRLARYALRLRHREDAGMGEIGLTAQDNSITVQIEKTGKGNSLIMGNITLERVR